MGGEGAGERPETQNRAPVAQLSGTSPRMAHDTGSIPSVRAPVLLGQLSLPMLVFCAPCKDLEPEDRNNSPGSTQGWPTTIFKSLKSNTINLEVLSWAHAPVFCQVLVFVGFLQGFEPITALDPHKEGPQPCLKISTSKTITLDVLSWAHAQS